MANQSYPTSLAELTIGDLERSWLPAGAEDAPEPTTKETVEQLCALLRLDFDDVWGSWGVAEMSAMVQSMRWFFETDYYSLKTQHAFEFKGRKFAFKEQFAHNSFGQFADVETINKGIANPFTRIRQAAAIFCLPAGADKYDADLVRNRMDAFSELPADIALGFGGFFLARGKQLSEITLQHSALAAVVEQQQKQTSDYRTSTVGTQSSSRSAAIAWLAPKLSRYFA